MSVRIMTLVWDAQLAAGEKLVLLALADCANDEGHCWPSVGTLTRKTGQSERTVQAMLKSLADAGHISRDQRVGKGCYYTIHPRSNCTPAKSAPPQKTAKTPAESAPKPSRTVNYKPPLPPEGEFELDLCEPEQIDPVDQLVATWNEVADIHDLPKVRKLDDTRRRAAAKRIAEHGLEEMQECVGRIALSPFLSGKTPEKFLADFKFLVTPSKLSRLQEGFYDERQRDPPTQHRRQGSGTVTVIGDFAKRMRA